MDSPHHDGATAREQASTQVRVAFYGRAGSPEQAQLDVRWQLHAVRTALPDNIPVVRCFADVGPWNGLGSSGRSTTGWWLDSHPIDGGIDQLLAAAESPDRDFEVVACSSIDRLSRRTTDEIRIEKHLAEYGARVVTADDTAITTLPRSIMLITTAPALLHRWAWESLPRERTRRTGTHREMRRAPGTTAGQRQAPSGRAGEAMCND